MDTLSPDFARQTESPIWSAEVWKMYASFYIAIDFACSSKKTEVVLFTWFDTNKT